MITIIIVVVILLVLSSIGSILSYVFYFGKADEVKPTAKTTAASTTVAAATTPVLTDDGKASFLAHLNDNPEALVTIRTKLNGDVIFKNALINSIITDEVFGTKVLTIANGSPQLKVILDSMKKDIADNYTYLKSYVNSETLASTENSTNNMKKNSMWCADGTYDCNIPSSSTGLGIGNKKYIVFGNDLKTSEKEPNAGKIGYALFGNEKNLDIVGAGPNDTDRRVMIYDNLFVKKSVSTPEIGTDNFRIKEDTNTKGDKDICIFGTDSKGKYRKLYCIMGGVVPA